MNAVKIDYPTNGKVIGKYEFNPTQPNLAGTSYSGAEVGSEGLQAFYGHISETYTNKLEWPGAYDIFNVMRRRDPTLRSLINAVKMMARQSQWSGHSVSNKLPDRIAADFLQSNLEDMSHTVEDFIDDVLSFLWAGWSSFEICYKRREGKAGEHKSQFNDGLIGWRKLAYRRQSTLSRWIFDNSGGFGGWYQSAPPLYEEKELKSNKLLHFVGERDGNNPEGISLFESAYEAWHFVTNLQIINGIGWQRTFVGLPVFEFADRPNPDDKAAVESTGQALTVDEKQYISVPAGIKFRLESTSNSGAESLLNTIKMYRALMLEIVLGEFLMQSLLGTGSFAAQSDKSQLFLMAVNGYLDKIAAVWNRFGVTRLFEANPGQFPGITQLPYVGHSDIIKPNLAGLGSFISQIAPYIKLGTEDEIWIRELAGLPTIDKKQRQEEAAAPAAKPHTPVDPLAQVKDILSNMSATVPLSTVDFAESDGRDKERSELEEILSGDFSGFLKGQWERIKAAATTSPAALNDDSFWENEKALMLSSILGGLAKMALKLITMSFTDTETSYNIGADWGMANEMALKWAREFSGEQIKQITDTTKGSVKAAVSNWIETGGTLKELQDTLTPTFGKDRAKRIAATEVTKAYAEGSVIGWKSSGMADLEPEKKPVDDSHIGCRCWLTIQPRDGKWVYVWQSANDERVCFPAGTLVMTNKGYRDIKDIVAGDIVLTREGYKDVIATSVTDYTGNLVAILHENGALVCTESHPIWVSEQGWLQARYINIGDRLNTVNNQTSNVLRVFNFNVRDADNLPTSVIEIIRLSGVFFDVAVPIDTIGFQSNTQVNQQEVNAISSHSSLLDVFNTKRFKASSNVLLKYCFSFKGTIARHATKLTVGIGRFYSYFSSTVFTRLVIRRSAALFGAEMSFVSSLGGNKYLTASFAGNTQNVTMPTGYATNCIPIGYGAIDSKLFATNRTSLFDGGDSGNTTLLRTIFFSSFNPGWLKIKLLTTLRTFSKLATSCSFLNTIFEFIVGRRHSIRPLTDIDKVYHSKCAKSILVYNLQVKDDPVFYANDILVHNCPICGPLHDQEVGIARKQLGNG